MKRNSKRVMCYLLTFVIVFLCSGLTPTNATTKYSQMKVHYIDVGESDSVLIESNKHFMLIDAGDTGDDSNVVDYLSSQNVEKLDYIICTHPHADHIGGMDSVIDEFVIDKVIMPNKTHTTQAFESVLTAIKNKGLKITKPVVGTKYTIGEANFTIISPNNYSYGGNLNNYSVGIKLVNGNDSFIFIGDNETEAIEDIISNQINLDANVLMCGHHGSDTSISEELLDAVTPNYAIISVGENSYGHPSEETLKLLDKYNVATYRTDENGTIVAISNGTNITFNFNRTGVKIVTPTPTPTVDPTLTPTPTPVPTLVPTLTLAPTPTPIIIVDTQSETVYITSSGQKYHRPSCSYLKSSYTAISLSDAKSQGYVPCSRCNPPE